MSEATPSTGGPLTFQFLDVGQGDGIYIEFPNGKNMLVDLGSTKNKDLTNGDVLRYFAGQTRFRSPSTLNYLVLTHGDQDHYNLVLPFIRHFKLTVQNLIYGGYDSHYTYGKKPDKSTPTEKHLPAIKELAQKILTFTGSGPHALGRPDDFGGVQVIIQAIDAPCVNKANAWLHNTPSVVLQLIYAGQSVILSGDATIDTEAYILGYWETVFKSSGSQGSGGTGGTVSEDEMDVADDFEGVDHPLQSVVLKVGHHGSLRTSIRPEWIEAISPQYIFISSDRSGWTGTRQESKEEGLKKYKLTHHRLPQQICIDVIADNTDLATDCAQHPYVAAYDPADYTSDEYRHLRKEYPSGFADPHPGQKIGWTQTATTEGIFTTLTAMDVGIDPETGEPYDQGAQYQLSIQSDGSLQIYSSFDYMQHGSQVAAGTRGK